MSVRQTWFFRGLLVTVALLLFLRLVSLASLQNEIYGDIAIVYRYVDQILKGEWPLQFVLSAGPLYHYVIAPIIALTGLNYAGIKLASVIVSLGVLLATYALSRRLVGDTFALLATFVAGVSSWLLIFSRLGNSQILVPLLSTCALWLAVRVAQDARRTDVVACAVVSALGLYTYPQTFILPGVIFGTLLCLRWTGQRVRWSDLWLFVGVTLLCTLPFVWIVFQDLENFTSGYVGGKIQPAGHPAAILLTNAMNALLATHAHGDIVFRSNPRELPHLDPISGAFFLLGLLFWLWPPRWRWLPVLLVPYVLLQVPSILVLSYPREVPSASRTLAVAPLAYILAASGIWWLGHTIWRIGWPRVALLLATALLGTMTFLNTQRYFRDYIGGLPYHNTSIGRHIATYADLLPPDTHVYVVGDQWEAKMPTFSSIKYAIRWPLRLHHIEDPAGLTCEELAELQQPAVLVWSFHEALPAPGLATCRQSLSPQLHTSAGGLPVFHAAPLQNDPAAQLPGYSTVLANGQTLGVLHSALDIGLVPDLFDNNPMTLIRSARANPLLLELRFEQPYGISRVGLHLATMSRVQITLDATHADGTRSSQTHLFTDLPPDPQVALPLFDTPTRITILQIAIQDMAPLDSTGTHVHLRELTLQ